MTGYTNLKALFHDPTAAAVDTIFGEVSPTGMAVAAGESTFDSIVASFHVVHADLAERAAVSIDWDLALNACRALGRTLAFTLSV